MVTLTLTMILSLITVEHLTLIALDVYNEGHNNNNKHNNKAPNLNPNHT